jgi:hypothetical protein
MEARTLRRLTAFLRKVRGVTEVLIREHRIDGLREDMGRKADMLGIITEIDRCCRRKSSSNTCPGAIASAARSASQCFLRGEFANPISATRYIWYLFTEADSVRCRYQSELELFFWRLRDRLSRRVNSERRKAAKAGTVL